MASGNETVEDVTRRVARERAARETGAPPAAEGPEPGDPWRACGCLLLIALVLLGAGFAAGLWVAG